MKTNVEMTREYQLNGITVIQRTKDAYFDANALIHEYNKQNPDNKKEWGKFFNRNFTAQEFVFTILKREFKEELCNYLITKLSNNCSIMQLSDIKYSLELTNNTQYEKLINKLIVKRISGLRCKKEIDKIWVHPLVFLDFAMWLNPDFKYDAVKMVYDKLIQLRIEVGDNTNPYNKWIEETFGKSQHNISNIRQGLNKAVFGYHDSVINQRDYATIKELEQYKYYERLIQDFVRAGFFTKVTDITQYLKKEQEKNFPTKSIEIV